MLDSMDTVGTFEAKTHLSRLLDRVAAGEQTAITRHGILLDRVAAGEQTAITRHGIPIARLVPVKPASSLQIRETIAKLKRFSKARRSVA
jgi:prevent-host-death family protein